MAEENATTKKGLFRSFKASYKKAKSEMSAFKEAKDHWNDAKDLVDAGFDPEDVIKEMDRCLRFGGLGITDEDINELYRKHAENLWVGLNNGVLGYEHAVSKLNEKLSGIGATLFDLRKAEVNEDPQIKELLANIAFTYMMSQGIAVQVTPGGAGQISDLENNLKKLYELTDKLEIPLEEIVGENGNYNYILERGYLSKARIALIRGLWRGKDFSDSVNEMDNYLKLAQKYNPKLTRADIPITDGQINEILSSQ